MSPTNNSLACCSNGGGGSDERGVVEGSNAKYLVVRRCDVPGDNFEGLENGIMEQQRAPGMSIVKFSRVQMEQYHCARLPLCYDTVRFEK
jgi:hypothetical protein